MAPHDPQIIEAAGAELVRKLGGRWQRGGGMCRCPAHDDHAPSLSVRVGYRSLLFKCFAGCTVGEVLRAVRRLHFRVPRQDVDAPFRRSADVGNRMRDRAVALWDAARPLPGTPGADYLLRRRIDTETTALRFHASAPAGRGPFAQFRPALIAAIVDTSGVVAVQRIFLDRHLPMLASDMERPKLMLGRPLGGAVRLAEPGPVLGLAEGVETALSASLLLGFPVWATLGNERLSRIALPPGLERLVLLPDADRAGRLAARRALDCYGGTVPTIDVLWPWYGRNDWNDVLRHEGEGEGTPVRRAA